MATCCFICSSWNIVDISLLHFKDAWVRIGSSVQSR